ncbi:diguanylate cyclase [Agrobacterium vitis]
MYPWSELLANLAIVAITTSTWTFVRPHLAGQGARAFSLAFGCLMAVGLLATMALPFRFTEGVFLDTRYTFLAISGFFGGPIAAFPPLIVGIIRRLMIGGMGITVGIPQIIAAACIGVVASRLLRGKIPTFPQIAALALFVAVSGVAGFFVVRPFEVWGNLIVVTVGPFMVVLFGATLLSAVAIAQEMKRTRLESDLAAAQIRLADALATMADGLALFDRDGVLVFTNQRYLDIFKETADVRVPGKNIREILRTSFERNEEAGVESDVDPIIDRVVEGLFRPSDRLIQLADGRSIEARTRVTGEGEAMIVYADITLHCQREARLHELNDRLSALADTDELTGLMNRRGLEASMDQAFDRAKGEGANIGLLLIDVDWFKAYNDTYGHPAGDKCLQLVANTVHATSRSFAGSIVARYGGEELTVVLPNASISETEAVARLVCTAVRTLAIEHVGSEKRIVTVSVGAANLKSMPGLRKTDLLLQADAALYAAKAAGRDCIQTAPDLLPVAKRADSR